MKLDIRFPIGLLFSILGSLLVIHGSVSDSTIYERSLGLNINLWWGGVMLALGVTMLLLVRKSLIRK